MTKEEYASKLHLLRQELNGLRDDINNLESNEIIQQDRFEVLQQEYDKLKGEKSFQVDINLGLHKEIIEIKKEHAALKAKADKMADALLSLLGQKATEVGTPADFYRDVFETAKGIRSSYNSNTNQNENNENRD